MFLCFSGAARKDTREHHCCSTRISKHSPFISCFIKSNQESLFSNRSYDLSTLIDNYLVSLLEQDRDWEPLDLRLVLTYATEKQRKTLEIYLIKRIREIPEENTQERRQYIEKYNVIYPKITSDFARMINSCSESLSGLVQPYEENACHDHVVYARLTQDLEENYPIKKLYCIAIGSD